MNCNFKRYLMYTQGSIKRKMKIYFSPTTPLHLASLSKRLQWYEEEEKRTTYIFYAWMSATTLLFLSLVLWRICLSNMRKQTNKQKLFVKCLWMNWLIATNIYNVNKNAWGNIYIAEKTIKARAIWPNFKSLIVAKISASQFQQ